MQTDTPIVSYTAKSILSEAQKVFFVGSNHSGNVALTGTVWLNFNDDAYSGFTVDNAGQVTATVVVIKGVGDLKGFLAEVIQSLDPKLNPGESFKLAGIASNFPGCVAGKLWSCIIILVQEGLLVISPPKAG